MDLDEQVRLTLNKIWDSTIIHTRVLKRVLLLEEPYTYKTKIIKFQIPSLNHKRHKEETKSQQSPFKAIHHQHKSSDRYLNSTSMIISHSYFLICKNNRFKIHFLERSYGLCACDNHNPPSTCSLRFMRTTFNVFIF